MKLTGITPAALIQGTLADARSALESVRDQKTSELAATDLQKLPKPLRETAKKALGSEKAVSAKAVVDALEAQLNDKLKKSIGAGALLTEEVDQSLFDLMSYSRVGLQLEQALLSSQGALTPDAADAAARFALKNASASAKGQANLFKTLKRALEAHTESDPFSKASKGLKEHVKARGDALKSAVDDAVTAALADLETGRDAGTIESARLALGAAIEVYQAVNPKASALQGWRGKLKELGEPETKEPEPFFAQFLESQLGEKHAYPVKAEGQTTLVTMKFPSDVEDAGPDGGGSIETLGDYLKQKNLTPQKLLETNHVLSGAARELLKAAGIASPTDSQIKDTQAQIADAVESGNYADFKSDMKPSMVKLADNIEQREGNTFYEKEWFAPKDLNAEKLKLAEKDLKKLNGDFESGRAGMILAATFVNSSRRAEGDFTRAYGDDAWHGFMRAHTNLQKIPKGELFEKLDLDLVLETNRLIHAPDNYLMGKVLRGIAAIGRGFRWDKGGELREGRQFARPDKYTKDEVDALRQAGVKMVVTNVSSDGTRSAMLEYPPASEVKGKLEELLQWTRAESRKEDADPIAIAAEFQRRFVAIHPFGDSNGRTSRLLMNRILGEYDLPPAILKNQNRDMSVAPDLYRDKVAQGIARSKKFLSSARLESKSMYAKKLGVKLLEESPDKPVTLDGSPFDLGQDGFLYDPAGRPWLAFGDELAPLSQLEHYSIIRRISQMETEPAEDTLAKLTAETRYLYRTVSDDAAAGEKIKIRPESRVREADMDYRLSPEREVAELLVDLCDVNKLDRARLFSVKNAKGTDISSSISKHSQVDLEMWYVEKGLKEQGFDDLADKVYKHRENLFAVARGHLHTLVGEERISSDNPFGFAFKYEQMMYENSPLKYESLDEAIESEGDRTVTVWRGDYGFARLLGMAPNNDIRQPDAKDVAKDRASNQTITNMYDDFMKLEGSAMGRQYISTTSDLGLLTKAFATKVASQKVNLGPVPDFIADKLLAWAADTREGENETQKKENRTKLNEGRESNGLDPLPANGAREIKDTLGVPGSILQIRAASGGKKELEVRASRKAFLLRLDKTAVLPGVVALGGHTFEAEQELHGLERVYPWQVAGVYDAKGLTDELPVTNEALAAKKKEEAEKQKELEAAAAKWEAKHGDAKKGDLDVKGADWKKGDYDAKGADWGKGDYDYKKGDYDFKKGDLDVKGADWGKGDYDAKGAFNKGDFGAKESEVLMADGPFVPLDAAPAPATGAADFKKGDPDLDPHTPDDDGAMG